MAVLPNVLSIPASRPLLATLAAAILDGQVIAGWPDRSDPLSLASGTILLPNRRACRAMRDAFLDLSGGEPVLLPRIAPIGDVDEDEWAFADPNPLDRLGIDAIRPAMAGLERQLTLAALVRRWAESVDRAVVRLGADEPLIVSTSTGDALSLASDLMRLMDQVETERVAWAGLETIVEAGLDRFWAMTRDFLTIATRHWPALLAERGLQEPAVRRDQLIAAETERLKAAAGPLIAAGSTGSILATRDLLRAVALHPKGALVLPGLDRDLDAASWAAIAGEGGAKAHGHPQYGLKRLIDHVGILAGDVRELSGPAPHGRERLMSDVMRPAATTEAWLEARTVAGPSMLDGITVIEAQAERDEALAVALVLREIAEDPTRRAALVTPDRALARRVTAELARWQVVVDDSGGRPLGTSPAATVARLVAAIALDDPAPAQVLALLAHPAIDLGLDADRLADAIAAIELRVLRGLRPQGGLAGYCRVLDEAVPLEGSAIDPLRRVTAEALADGRSVMSLLFQALRHFDEVLQGGPIPLAELALRHGRALSDLRLKADAEGTEALLDLLTRMAGPAAAEFLIPVGDYPAALDALMSTETVRMAADPGARIRILGLPEARLLAVDTVVMAGLVEGSWPGDPKLDPWLNRAMRSAFGIDPPERRIGLAAHDFCQLLGTPRVVLSRAAKTGGVPTVASRWVQRLAAVLGGETWALLKARGDQVLALAQELDRPAAVVPVLRPQPAPPLELRPARLSVTEIETLLRDPYAIYARHVLMLRPLDALDEEPGAAERGTLIHDALAAYAQEIARTGIPADPVGRLLAIGQDKFQPFWADPTVRAVWWPRFMAIARWFVADDLARRPDLQGVHVELGGRMEWDTPGGRRFVLTARADRIEVRADGALDVIDYKTGQPPSKPQVESGLSPQLPLEAAVARAGGFKGIPKDMPVAGLVYVKLGGRDPAGEVLPIQPDMGVAGLVEDVEEKLRGLVAAFENPAQGYLSWAIPQFATGRSNDYAHLARVKEWAASGGGE
ncbi:double-strand break repair protein AddB [Phreatobacter aquaticus]|uniref:Double-strand break repair protein AddB n=1 Tax=Phreatobacter aquaticus TaxID=2570229 RepID=A0A4D7QF08_9HYPH|nr:double-strand break repair protein AddB [Phreatobacter aquaticus]QCK85191.1 double-strand break repair protein AddB [Phreatobacter aquaticus]